jgi:ABC-2 type transport system permease protein
VATPTELWSYRTLIANLTQRELKARYKRSVLGWGWSLLNPAATLGVYTLVFGVFFKAQPPEAGHDGATVFALFLFTGLIVWNLFSQVVSGGMDALVANGPLLKKVYFPPEAPVIANALVTLNQTVIETGVLIFIMVLVGNVSWTFLLYPLVLALLLMFALGLALMLSVLNVYYRDVQYLVMILLQLLFYCTPIIYNIDQVPETVGPVPTRSLIELNPIAQFVAAARDCFYFLEAPSLAQWGGLLLCSVTMLVIGWNVFSRASRDVSEVL